MLHLPESNSIPIVDVANPSEIIIESETSETQELSENTSSADYLNNI